MILAIISIVAIPVLVSICWTHILSFLNGPVRNRLEKIFGADRCKWYVNFLVWADNNMTAAKRVIKMQWKKFKDTILSVKSKYIDNGNGTYTKNSESIVRASPTSGRRVVEEEIVDWADLPAKVRDEMLRQRTKKAELDDMAVAEEKFRQRAAEDGIELVA